MKPTRRVEVAFKVIRRLANESGYGSWIGDDVCMNIATEVVAALDESDRFKRMKEGDS